MKCEFKFACSFHVDQFTFDISLPSLKFTIFIQSINQSISINFNLNSHKHYFYGVEKEK